MNDCPRNIFRLAGQVGIVLLIPLTLIACDREQDQGPGPVRETVDRSSVMGNPIGDFDQMPFGAPPFHQIDPEHFLAALRAAVERADERLIEITSNQALPDFENTVMALEESVRPVARIARLWYGLAAVDRQFGEVDGEAFVQLLTEHGQRVLHDRELFARIVQLREGERMARLEPAQRRLVNEAWRRFRRSGAHLDDSDRQALAELDQRIADLDHRYSEVRRSATHRHELLIEDEDRLDELPDSLVLLARQSARDRGHAEGWVFTLNAHSFYPFMRHFPGRDERRELYRAWMTRYRDVLKSDEDLGRLIGRLAELRAQRARMLGFDSHLDYLLDDATLPERETLESLLRQLTQAAGAKAGRERKRLAGLAAEDGIEGELQPWDWWYYRERLIESELDFDQAAIRRFFEVDGVREGLFKLANRLWGLTFHRRSELPVWHMDVSAFEVRDEMGATLGVVYFDPIHRAGKSGGAWTSHYRVQHRENGERVSPVTAIVTNLTPPAAGQPALLSSEQVRTLFHEFGHALHSVLSEVDHAALAGTNVAPDFVEFPALLLEHWSLHPEVLRSYARHHETGALIDDQSMRALQRRSELTAGLEMLELLAAVELELALHGAQAGEVPDLETAEAGVREALELPAMISPRHHGGGLASLFANQRRGGDFRTLWSELLAADAFAAFEQAGVTNRELADRLRREILSRGNTRDPMESWQAFRGRAPEARFLLEARGLQPGPDQGDAQTPGGE